MLNRETMTHALIGQNGSRHVAYDLMHPHHDPPGVLRVKSQRLHMRIDFAPLLRPVSADFFRPPDKTAFERSRPSHVRRHEQDGGVNIPRVEGRVGCAKQFDLWGRFIGRCHFSPHSLPAARIALNTQLAKRLLRPELAR